ncbi:exocyst complex component EXO70B1-like [Phalaenopsis equestris]|uniref:exocyst complex component EXO70B1-like n=1 Tax=Phalaenopsis equestris TaxID=78828 RepID=UPI0009E5F671|nr:exocyst complex component EXO70B1-like [Phalaenopsis equestris]
MAEHGEEKLIEVARHIAKTLGRTDTMANDILRIFSDFDGRFTRERLTADHNPDDSISDDQPTPTAVSSSIDRKISRFLSSDISIWSDASDAAAFLDAVDSLIASVRGINPSAALNRADDLLQQCMLRLEDEFRSMLENPFRDSLFDPVTPPELDSDGEEDQIPVASPVTDYDFFIDALPPGTLSDVHEIAKRMVAAGFGEECARAYSIARQDFLEESICRLGIRLRTPKIEDFGRATWTELEDEIFRWIKAMNVAFRILFPSERRLCRRIFSGSPAVADLSFAEVCRGPVIQLLRFADAISSGKRSPEKLFRVIDMYEAFRDIVPELDALFSDKYSESIQAEVFTVWKKLGSAIRGIFTEFDNLIRRDPATEAVPGGGLHPITRYVMNYLVAACDSRRTLEEVMDGDELPDAGDRLPEQDSSPFAAQIAWIMEVLQGNLRTKARVYREPALSCIFLMNNCRYMMQKVSSSSEMLMLLGEDWPRRQAALERQWAAKYQKSSWGKVTAVLRIDGDNLPTADVMRERLGMVDVYLEETRQSQMDWVVADEGLRKELRVAAARIVLPAYRSFLEVYRVLVEGRRNGEKNLRHHSAREVGMKINELFEGSRRP